MASTGRLGGVIALSGLAGLAAAAFAGGVARPELGAFPVFVLVSLSLVVGLSTAASP